MSCVCASRVCSTASHQVAHDLTHKARQRDPVDQEKLNPQRSRRSGVGGNLRGTSVNAGMVPPPLAGPSGAALGADQTYKHISCAALGDAEGCRPAHATSSVPAGSFKPCTAPLPAIRRLNHCAAQNNTRDFPRPTLFSAFVCATTQRMLISPNKNPLQLRRYHVHVVAITSG